MNIIKIFELLKDTNFKYFEGTINKIVPIQIFFSTIRGGKGNSISIEELDNLYFDLEVYINLGEDSINNEFSNLSEDELFEKLTEILKTHKL